MLQRQGSGMCVCVVEGCRRMRPVGIVVETERGEVMGGGGRIGVWEDGGNSGGYIVR